MDVKLKQIPFPCTSPSSCHLPRFLRPQQRLLPFAERTERLSLTWAGEGRHTRRRPKSGAGIECLHEPPGIGDETLRAAEPPLPAAKAPPPLRGPGQPLISPRPARPDRHRPSCGSCAHMGTVATGSAKAGRGGQRCAVTGRPRGPHPASLPDLTGMAIAMAAAAARARRWHRGTITPPRLRPPRPAANPRALRWPRNQWRAGEGGAEGSPTNGSGEAVAMGGAPCRHGNGGAGGACWPQRGGRGLGRQRAARGSEGLTGLRRADRNLERSPAGLTGRQRLWNGV